MRDKSMGPATALLSAFLFGLSPVLIKKVIGEMSPLLMAGLLYLGSGVGLQLLLFFRGNPGFHELRNLKFAQKIKLAFAVVCGGVIAPILLAYGIKLGSAFEVSLLLNLETVATTFLAWFAFKEHVGREVWIGKVMLILGAVVVSFRPETRIMFSVSGLFILGACVFWGVDNNLTRDVEDLSPTVLASIKGLTAGCVNCVVGITAGVGVVHISQILGTLGIGAISYGLSLVLFIVALRSMGASRTGTYFASGPFIGMLGAILFLGERPQIYQWVSPLLMIVGLRLLYGERHSHIHTHESLTHSHKHVHDEHHQHVHDGTEGPEPHEHIHIHEPITHAHPHFPDIHHRHRHK